jgi:fibronectin-binding autotransporter adhesin
MKPKLNSLIAAFAPLSRSSIIVCASLCAVTSVRAADLHKANNTLSLQTASSWTENVTPTSADTLVFDNTITSGPLDVAASYLQYAVGTLRFLNPAGNITLNWSGTSTAYQSSFIDMSASTVDVTLTGGSLRISSGTYNPTISVASGRTLTVNSGLSNQGNSKTFTFAGAGNVIINSNSGGGGAMNFVVNGPTVTMNNIASGWTYGTVTSGKLILTTGTVLDGKSLYMNSANGLEFGTGLTAVSLGALGGSGDIVLGNFDLAPVALTFGSNNSNQTYTGVLSGDGSIKKVGTGTQTISGANSYTAGTSIEGGGVTLNAEGAKLGSGAVTLSNGANLTMFRGNANDNSTNPAFSNELIIPTGQSGSFYSMPRGTWSGALSGAGTLDLRVNYVRGDVTGNWSAFTGQVNVTSRTGGDEFRIALGGGGTGLQLAGGKLNLADGVNMYQSVNPPTGEGTQTVHTIGELSGSAGAAIRGGPVFGRFTNWTVGSLGTDSIFAGTIKDNAGVSRLTKVGTGTLTLSGINTYTGATMVTAGTLALSGDGDIAGSASVTLAAGAKLDTTVGTYAPASTQPITIGLDAAGAGSSGRIDAASLNISDANVAFTISGTLDDAQYVIANYSGTLTGTFGVAPPTGYTFDYGTGTNSQIKLVSTSAPAGYSSWASLNGASANANEDHDNDGVANGVEFFIGGPNGNTTGFTPLPGVTTVGGSRSVTWTFGAGYTGTYGTDYVVQTSTTLAAGSWTNETLGGNVVVSGNNVTYTFPAGPVKNFARLVVTP